MRCLSRIGISCHFEGYRSQIHEGTEGLDSERCQRRSLLESLWLNRPGSKSEERFHERVRHWKELAHELLIELSTLRRVTNSLNQLYYEGKQALSPQLAQGFEELVGYIERLVELYNRDLTEGLDRLITLLVSDMPNQTPGKWSYKQQGEIVIAHNPRPATPVALPGELESAINSSFPGVRENVVKDLTRLLQGNHRGLALAAQEALQRLIDDDSRRVSALAGEALATFAGVPMQPPVEEKIVAVEEDEAQRLEAETARKQAEEAERERRRQEHLSNLYAQGVRASEAEDWDAAIDAFMGVLEIDRQYEDAATLLEQAKVKKQQEEARQRRLRQLYEEGRRAAEAGEWDVAVDAFQAVLDLDSRYEDATALLERTKADQETERAQREWISNLYALGVRAIEAEDWDAATYSLGRVVEFDEQYEDATTLLARVKASIEAERTRREQLSAQYIEETRAPKPQVSASVEQAEEPDTRLLEHPQPTEYAAPDIFVGLAASWARADISPMLDERQVMAHSGLNFGPRQAGDIRGELLGTSRSLVLTNRRLILIGVSALGAFSRSSKGKVTLEIKLDDIQSAGVTLRGFSAICWLWLPYSLLVWLVTRRLMVKYLENGVPKQALFHVPYARGWVTAIRAAADARGQSL